MPIVVTDKGQARFGYRTRSTDKARKVAKNLDPKDYNISEVTTARAHAVKQPTMACRRAAMLDHILSDWLAACRGDLEEACRSLPYTTTKAAEWDLVRYQIPRAGWEWAVRHWFNGGLRRSVEDWKANLPEEARKQIDKEWSKYCD